MKLRSLAGLAAALVALALPAAAHAGPTVSVRVEGENHTLLERTTVTLSGQAVPGNDQCAGDTAGAALEAAVHANWDRAPGGFVTSLLGETHDFSRSDYWAVWIDTGSGYERGNGVCVQKVQEGNEVLMLVDAPPYGEGSTTETPLALRGVPATAHRGQAIAVTVVAAITTTPYGDPGDGHDRPVAGATVSGAGVSATTGADGRAIVTAPDSGDVLLKASKPGTVPSAAERVVVTDAPAAGAAPDDEPSTLRDTAGPLGRIAGIREKQRFRRRRAPRELRGTVAADPSGLRAVKLRLTRQVGRRCWYFSGSRERFLRRRCGTRHAFKVGEEERWSYLLPRRLRRGRYVLDVIAMDRAGNRDALERGRSRVVFRVR